MRSVSFVVAGVLLVAGCSSGVAARQGTPSSTPARILAAPQAVPRPTASTTLSPTASTTVAAPVVNPCAGNARAKLVTVSIRSQHMWLCARAVVAYGSAITSGVVGRYTSTPTGRYTIQGVSRNTSLTLIDGSSYRVKYWIPFDAPLFGFHDSSWQDFPYGSAKYKTRGSHGCVHLPLASIAFLARWAPIGTRVTIRA